MKIFEQSAGIAESGDARATTAGAKAPSKAPSKAPLAIGGLFWNSTLALGGFGVASFGLTLLLVALGSLAFGWDFGAIMGPATLVFLLCLYIAVHGFSGAVALDDAAHPARLWTIGVLLAVGSLLLGSVVLAGLGVWAPASFLGYLIFNMALTFSMAVASLKLSFALTDPRVQTDGWL